MSRVVVMRTIPEPGLALLRGRGLEVAVGGPIAGVHGILCTLAETIDEALLETAGPSLRAVANYGVGFNNIDLAAASRRGILVSNTPGVLTEATADLAFALLLAVARRVVEGDTLVRSGRWTGWEPMQMLGLEVGSRTLGIVGAGRIGVAVARRAAGFAMPVLYVARRPSIEMDALGGQQVTLDDCLERADFVSLHLSLTPETRHTIGARELARMRRGAVLINTARGPVVDERALVLALREGHLAGAGLDVFEREPVLEPGLASLPNVVLLPHLGSATVGARTRMAVMAAENLAEALAGRRPPNLVNPEAWSAAER